MIISFKDVAHVNVKSKFLIEQVQVTTNLQPEGYSEDICMRWK